MIFYAIKNKKNKRYVIGYNQHYAVRKREFTYTPKYEISLSYLNHQKLKYIIKCLIECKLQSVLENCEIIAHKQQMIKTRFTVGKLKEKMGQEVLAQILKGKK